MDKFQILSLPAADEGEEVQELLFIATENEKWYSCFEKHFGSFL